MASSETTLQPPTLDGIVATASARVAQHTHISGLGLHPDGTAKPISHGMVGQIEGREAAGIVVDLIRAKKIAGKAILIVGPSGTGKTAIALAVSKELGPKVPFCAMSASEIHSREVKKTEILNENLRRSISIRVRETKEVYEGEVIDLSVEEVENPHGGYGKAVSAVIITLKTVKGSKTLKLPAQFHDSIQKQKVKLGDVVYIEHSGVINRVGRCDAYATEFDLETEEFVPLPKGQVFKKREVVQDVTLHDLDLANSKPQGGADVFSVISQFMAPKKTEITERLRSEVNKVVDKYLENGMAELIPGVLFIDEAHMLDVESFTFLNRALESEHSPVLILATNRGVSRVRGTEDLFAPHGIPVDFLDRILIIKTIPFAPEEAIQIISLRANVEGIKLENAALAKLGALSQSTSLRFALQLLTPASILAEAEGRNMIEAKDIDEVDSLFLDVKTSAKRLRENKAKFTLG